MSFVEPADLPPNRRVPPKHPKGSYSIDPITRRRLYGTSDTSDSKPLTTPKGNYTFFGTDKIQNVTSCNFNKVIKCMEKTFIMFYDPTSGNSGCAGVEFVKATEMPHPDNYAFAAVDCTQEHDLCTREGATTLPIFKLYSKGFDLLTIKNAKQLCADEMHKLMKTTEPRMIVAPGFQRR